MRFWLSAICFAVALAATPALAQDEGRGIGYVATGPIFTLPAGMSVERLEVHISIRSVRLAYVFKSATRQTVHFSFALPEIDRKSTRLKLQSLMRHSYAVFC